jgi:hypothetical protein
MCHDSSSKKFEDVVGFGVKEDNSAELIHAVVAFLLE